MISAKSFVFFLLVVIPLVIVVCLMWFGPLRRPHE
jgi:hypothetical protein